MKWVVGILAVAVIGYLVYRWTRATPERRGCAKVVELCGGGKKAVDQCVEGVNQAQKVVGEQAVERFASCTAESKTCAEAMGCVAGSAMQGIGGFLRGLDRAINH
jgi:hypothetical protein